MTLTMGSPKLRELTRTQLQSLAKREVVRAVGKTEDIIRRLVRKYPKGVPVPEGGGNLSASLTPPKRNLLKKPRKDRPSSSPVLKTSQDCPNPKGKGKSVAEAASPSPSSSTEALQQLLYPKGKRSFSAPQTFSLEEPVAGPSNAYPAENISVSHPHVPGLVPPSEHPSHGAYHEDRNARSAAPPPEAPNPDRQAEQEGEADYDYVKGAPNHYMVVDALRQFTTLVNIIPTMETRIAESRCLLQRTQTLLEKATPDVRELTVTREYLETFLLAKMKKKRELWDGTGKMEKQDRKLRMQWLRAERKAENEKRWREANEQNVKDGREREPFSVFASESDEEVIESLQTTPASSQSGSLKRTRESADVVSDAGSGVDESQRKRARS